MTEIQAGEYRVGINNFPDALKQLRASGYELMSAAELMRARIAGGLEFSISQTEGIVREGVIEFPNEKGIRLVRDSPLLSVGDYTDNVPRREFSMRRGEINVYNPPTSAAKTIEASLRESIVCPKNKIPLPTNRFGEDEVMVFLAGNNPELARDYGLLVKESLADNRIARPVVYIGEESGFGVRIETEFGLFRTVRKEFPGIGQIKISGIRKLSYGESYSGLSLVVFESYLSRPQHLFGIKRKN